MNNDVMHASAQVDRFIIENVKEVKETLAQLEVKAKSKSFGVSDLWNIRRRSRSASAMLQRHLGA